MVSWSLGGGLCPGGGSVWGVSVQGGHLCRPWQRPPTVTSGRYAPYWNAFLFTILLSYEFSSFQVLFWSWYSSPFSTLIPSNLITYDGENQQLTAVPDDIPANVEHLKLSGNRITEITANAFSNFDQLRYLDLFSNLISNIELGTFNSLKRLQHLYLQSNRISSLEPGIFSDLEEVNVLLLATIRLRQSGYPRRLVCGTCLSSGSKTTGSPLWMLMPSGMEFRLTKLNYTWQGTHSRAMRVCAGWTWSSRN